MIEPRQFLALYKGDIAGGEPLLCRVHSGTLVGDLFSSMPFDEGGTNLREAIAAIEKAGAGVVLYIPPKGDLARELEGLRAHDEERVAAAPEPPAADAGAPGKPGSAPKIPKPRASSPGG